MNATTTEQSFTTDQAVLNIVRSTKEEHDVVLSNRTVTVPANAPVRFQILNESDTLQRINDTNFGRSMVSAAVDAFFWQLYTILVLGFHAGLIEEGEVYKENVGYVNVSTYDGNAVKISPRQLALGGWFKVNYLNDGSDKPFTALSQAHPKAGYKHQAIDMLLNGNSFEVDVHTYPKWVDTIADSMEAGDVELRNARVADKISANAQRRATFRNMAEKNDTSVFEFSLRDGGQVSVDAVNGNGVVVIYAANGKILNRVALPATGWRLAELQAADARNLQVELQ